MQKVVFIDDDPMMLRMAAFIAKKAGAESAGCSSGEEGLAYIKDNAPAVAFIDVEMPVMNGFEVLGALGENGAFEKTKVYMMSGTVNEEVVSKASFLGAAGVIEKPLNAAEVIEIIKKSEGEV
ncbi:MAG: response regulator [Ruminococcus sp.]|nr:response regulator [Ruminococcus sp.]